MRRASACHHEAMKLLSFHMPKKFSDALRDEAGADAEVALFPAVEALLVPSAVLSRVRIPMRAPAVPDVQSARPPTLASLFLTGLPVLLCVHDSWCSPRRTCDRHKALTSAIDGSTGPPLGGSSYSGVRLQFGSKPRDEPCRRQRRVPSVVAAGAVIITAREPRSSDINCRGPDQGCDARLGGRG